MLFNSLVSQVETKENFAISLMKDDLMGRQYLRYFFLLFEIWARILYRGIKKKIMSTFFSGLKRGQSFRFMHIYVVNYKIILIL